MVLFKLDGILFNMELDMNNIAHNSRHILKAREVIQTEITALQALSETLDERFAHVVDLIFSCEGHVIISGVGKSGHIGQKISASLASTGTPAFFLHPTEATHGDLGMITKTSIVIAISYSGESRELIDVLQYCNTNKVPLIAMTCFEESTLGKSADFVLKLPKVTEACPNGLAPTSSTTATLALGDALTVAVMSKREFGREDFGRRHPGGKLGRSLQNVDTYLNLKAGPTPTVEEHCDIFETITAITNGRAGCVGVVNSNGELLGIVTDGDLRRAIQEGPSGLEKTASEIMTASTTTFSKSSKMSEVVQTFSAKRISNGFVVEDKKPVGIIHMKDLLIDGYI